MSKLELMIIYYALGAFIGAFLVLVVGTWQGYSFPKEATWTDAVLFLGSLLVMTKLGLQKIKDK